MLIYRSTFLWGGTSLQGVRPYSRILLAMSGPLFYCRRWNILVHLWFCCCFQSLSYLFRMLFSVLVQPFQRLLIIQIYDNCRVSCRSVFPLE